MEFYCSAETEKVTVETVVWFKMLCIHLSSRGRCCTSSSTAEADSLSASLDRHGNARNTVSTGTERD